MNHEYLLLDDLEQWLNLSVKTIKNASQVKTVFKVIQHMTDGMRVDDDLD